MSDAGWWVRWWLRYFPVLAWQRYARHCAHQSRYDGGGPCLDCGEPWFGACCPACGEKTHR